MDMDCNDDGDTHDNVAFNMDLNAGGCAVIAQPDDDERSSSNIDDGFSDNDSIVDAVIHLALAEKHCHLADADNDDDIHSLNSYVCFPDPRQTENNIASTKMKENSTVTSEGQKCGLVLKIMA